MRCRFGIDVTQPPCTDPGCAVCSICASSFNMDHAGTGPNQQRAAFANGGLRYGHGLYFSKVSSKSNDYSGGTECTKRDGFLGDRNWRCMFLCKVQ